MKVVVITQSKAKADEIVEITRMFEAGLGTLHLRKNRMSTKELETMIKAIPAHFHNRIIIHSHHRLALKYNLKGFHFTSTHLKNKFKLWWNTKWIYLRKPHLTKTISYTKISETYIKPEVSIDYCFLGTMFHNVSGELYSGFLNETIKAAVKNSGIEIYARGGVNERSIKLANELGFSGVALYSHLWNSESPSNKYIEFLRYCEKNNIPVE